MNQNHTIIRSHNSSWSCQNVGKQLHSELQVPTELPTEAATSPIEAPQTEVRDLCKDEIGNLSILKMTCEWSVVGEYIYVVMHIIFVDIFVEMICYIYLSINQSIFLSFFGGGLRMSNPMGYDQPWSTSPVLATITGVVLCNKQSNINTKSSSTGVFGVTSTGQSSPNTVKPQNKTPAKITLENTAITTEGCRNCTVKNPFCFPAPKMKFSLPGTNSGDWNSVLRCLGTEILQLCCRRWWRLMYNSGLSHWYGEIIKDNQGWVPTS